MSKLHYPHLHLSFTRDASSELDWRWPEDGDVLIFVHERLFRLINEWSLWPKTPVWIFPTASDLNGTLALPYYAGGILDVLYFRVRCCHQQAGRASWRKKRGMLIYGNSQNNSIYKRSISICSYFYDHSRQYMELVHKSQTTQKSVRWNLLFHHPVSCFSDYVTEAKNQIRIFCLHL